MAIGAGTCYNHNHNHTTHHHYYFTPAAMIGLAPVQDRFLYDVSVVSPACLLAHLLGGTHREPWRARCVPVPAVPVLTLSAPCAGARSSIFAMGGGSVTRRRERDALIIGDASTLRAGENGALAGVAPASSAAPATEASRRRRDVPRTM